MLQSPSLTARPTVGAPTAGYRFHSRRWGGGALRVRCQQATEDVAAVDRVSKSSGSRKAFSQAFCRLVGISTAPVQEVTPEQLANPPFAAYKPLLSELTVQQKRPYFM